MTLMPATPLSPMPAAGLPALTLGAVSLVSPAPERLAAFYGETLGLEPLPAEDGRLAFGAGGRPLVEIAGDAAARRAAERAPGLFHMAIRVPDRAALAVRLLAMHRYAVESGARLGASDHLVSEALYVDDPDGNGIEVYRDRPQDEWRHSADGGIAMATLPLDLNALAREATADRGPSPAGTDMGHVHLKVSDLDAARRFWVETVGLAVMARYPGALFTSAGGYHHHVGLNTWASRGAPPPAPGTAGLSHFTVHLAPGDLAALAGRLAAAGITATPAGAGGLRVADPSGNGVVFLPR